MYILQHGPLPDTQNCGLRMHREYREHFPRHRLQRKPLVSDPGMHHSTCVTHVPWCMPGSLTRGGGESVPGIPGACATHNFCFSEKRPMLHKVFTVVFLSKLFSIYHKFLLDEWFPIQSPNLDLTTHKIFVFFIIKGISVLSNIGVPCLLTMWRIQHLWIFFLYLSFYCMGQCVFTKCIVMFSGNHVIFF